MAKKPKYYAVWVGKSPGVYSSWPETQLQINGFPAAKYKAFDSKGEAEHAFTMPWQKFYAGPGGSLGRAGSGGSGGKGGSSGSVGSGGSTAKIVGGIRHLTAGGLHPAVIADSIAVDAACSGNPGVMEYRGVKTATAEEIFHSPIFPVGTNNIGEFLAIVHALALYHEKFPALTIYSDSRTAMAWVKKKKAKTNLERNEKTEKLWLLVERGEDWLKKHKFKNPLVKWETKKWGEIPADFGRK